MIENLKKIGIVLVWVIGVATLVAMLSFSGRKQKQVQCSNMIIEISDDAAFVLPSDVKRAVDKSNQQYLNKRLTSIRIDSLEKKLKTNSFVADAEVFVDLKGNLQIEVEQRKPILRVVNSSLQQFYIDDKGYKMPLSYQYTSRIPVAVGAINELYTRVDTLRGRTAKDLVTLATFIANKPFWAAQVDQIYVTNAGDFELITRVGNHRIVIGDVTNLEKKFNAVFLFYKKALPKLGWSMYNRINVKYEGQIICTKNSSL